MCIPVNFAKLLRTFIFQNIYKQLLLNSSHFKCMFKLLVILIKKDSVIQDIKKNRCGYPTLGSHLRSHPQGPSPPPQGLTLGPTPRSHPRVAPQGPTIGSWVPPQCLGPTFPVCLSEQLFQGTPSINCFLNVFCSMEAIA